MNLENILNDFENNVDNFLKKPPLLIELFYGKNINEAKNAIKDIKRLKNNYKPTQEWYVDTGKTIDKGYDTLKKIINNTYAVYDVVKPIYAFLKKLPFVKKLLPDYESEFKKKYNLKKIPSKSQVNRIFKDAYRLSTSLYSVIGESITGKDENFYLNNLNDYLKRYSA